MIDEVDEARKIAEAEAQIDAGQGVPHEKVREWLIELAAVESDVAAGRLVPHKDVEAWLRSWGTADELPCPEQPT